MRILAFLLCIIMLSCAEPYNYDIDPALEPIVNEFFYEAELRGKYYNRNITVSFNKEMKEAGVYHIGHNVVEMNYEFVMKHIYVDSANYNFVKLAVFHELGHWVGKEHRGGISIMNTNPDFGGCACGDFIGMVQFYNKDKANQKPIIDEFFAK